MATGFRIASAYVELNADEKGLRNDVKRAVRSATSGVDGKVKLQIDERGLRTRVERAIRQASRGTKGSFKLDIDGKALRADTRKKIERATAGLKIRIPVVADGRGLRTSVRAAIAEAEAGQRITIPVRIDDRMASNAFNNLNRQADRSHRHLSRWSKLTIAAVSLVPPAIAATSHALSAIAPASAVAVTGLSLLATMGATVAVGMNGVGEAIEQSGKDAKAYAKALQYLTPNARAFVEAVVAQKGAFKDLRDEVQQVLFTGLDTEMREMARTSIPSLRIGLGGMAIDLNAMARSLMDTTSELARTKTWDQMFGGLQLAMKPLRDMPGDILNSLVKLSISGTPLFIRMTTSMGNGMDKLNDKINKGFESGRLMMSINKAGDAFVNFFRKIGQNEQWQRFVNHMNDSGPDMARVIQKIAEAGLKLINDLGPLAGVALKIAGAFADVVNAMPDSLVQTILSYYLGFKLLKGVAGGVLATAAATGRLGGALRALVTGNAAAAIAQTIAPSLRSIGASSAGIGRTALVLGRLGQVGAIAAIGIGAAYLSYKAAHELWGKSPQTVGQATRAIQEFGRTGRIAAKDQDILSAATKRLSDKRSIMDKIYDVGTFHKNDEWKKATGDVKSYDDALAKLVKSGDGKLAKKFYDELSSAQKKQITDSGQYKKALADQKAALSLAETELGKYSRKAKETSTNLKNLRTDIKNATSAMFDQNQTARDASQGLADYDTASDDLAKTVGKVGLKWDAAKNSFIGTTEAQKDQIAKFGTLTQSAEDAGTKVLESSGSWEEANKVWGKGEKDLRRYLKQAGFAPGVIDDIVRSTYNLPSTKEIAIRVADHATGEIQDIGQKFRDVKDHKVIKVEVLSEATERYLEGLGFRVKHLDDGTFKIIADHKLTDQEMERLQKYEFDPKDIKIRGDKANYDEVAKKAKKDKIGDKTSRILGNANPFWDKKRGVDKSKLKNHTSTFYANSNPLREELKRVNALKPSKKTVEITWKHINKALPFGGKNAKGGKILPRFADGGSAASGGVLDGPGTETSDSIMALLSRGEYVMRAKAVKKYGANFMHRVNSGMLNPRRAFATGGAVSGAPMATGTGMGGSSQVSEAAKTGTFSVTDQTGKPIASAVKNFKMLEAATQATYKSITNNTSGFGNDFRDQMTGIGTRSLSLWTKQQNAFKSITAASQKKAEADTSAFGNSHVSKLTKTGSSAHNVWNSWGKGMQSRTSSTYGKLGSATSAFSKQSVSRIGNARDGMGKAWGGLSPRFKPPVSYLVHTVINKGVVGSMNAIMSKLGGGKKVGGISVPGFASGGHIKGPGTKTSDSIPARLSNGEFVMQASAVDKFGVGFMKKVNEGTIPKDGPGFGFAKGGPVNISVPSFAKGGVVGIPSADTLNKMMGEGSNADVKKMTDWIMSKFVLPLIDSGDGGSAMKEVQRAGMRHIRANVEKFVKDNFGGAGSAAAGLRWAKTQHGKPYQWGGNGNPSWDCSGFMSAIESVIRGEKPHRRWSTHAFKGGTPPGWRRGANRPFRVGITHAGVGHTAGSIGKTNVESSGSGVQVGRGARGYNNGMFSSWYGYVGPSGKHAKGGYISGPGGPTSDLIPSLLSNGEYVIRAAAVKKLGTSFLSAVNNGQVPGFATGGIVLPKVVKVKDKTGIQSAEGKKDLIGYATLSQESIDSGKTRSEVVNRFAAHESMTELLEDLWEAESKIRAAFKGAAQTKMLQVYEVANKASIAQQKKLDPILKSLEAANKEVEELTSSFDSFKDSVRDGIKSFANITKIGTYGTSPQTLINQMASDLAKSTDFANSLQALKAAGVNSEIIGQVAEAGITGGGLATAHSLLRATPEQIAKLNELQAQVSSIADKTGEAAAKGMYGAGLDAAKGLVAGLTAQKDQIEAAMLQIAKAMEASIKTALGIKSPSRVMMAVGGHTAEGFAMGLDKGQKRVQRSARDLAGIPAQAVSASPQTAVQGSVTYNFGDVKVCIEGTGVDLSNPTQVRGIAKAVGQAVKEEIRAGDRARR